MSENVELRTRQIISDVFGVPLEQVSLESSHTSIDGWDSVNILNVLMAVEAEFGVSVAPEEVEQFQSVGGIMTLLRSRGIE